MEQTTNAFWKAVHDNKVPSLRKIRKDEIVIEHDNCTREEGLELTNKTIQKLGTRYNAEVYDHSGKSPHVHIKNVQGLAELTAKPRQAYKKAFILKYAGNPDKADQSLAANEHYIATEGLPHYKISLENKPYDVKKLVRMINPEVKNELDKDLLRRDVKEWIIHERDGASKESITSLALLHGLQVNNNMILCPWHDDHEPSAALYEETGTLWCFGCQTWANYGMLKKRLQDKAPEDITLLKDPELLQRLLGEVKKKVAGEEDLLKFEIISACAMLVKNNVVEPHLMISSSSSAGKSYTTKATCKLFELTGRTELYTRLTPQALAYLHANEADWTWDGKLLYIEDAQQSLMDSDTLKVFLSEGLSKCASVQDGASNQTEVKGKPVVWVTNANVDLRDEMSNRFIIVNMDETAEQVYNVVDFQACLEESGGTSYDTRVLLGLKGLREVNVKIPFAIRLSKHFHVDKQRVKRDFPRFLALVKAHAALYQYQREVVDGVVLATGEDYEAVRTLYQAKILDTENYYGLSSNQSKALVKVRELLGKVECGSGLMTAQEIHAAAGCHSLPVWYDYLRLFEKHGLLKSERMLVGWNDAKGYKLTGLHDKWVLPCFAEL